MYKRPKCIIIFDILTPWCSVLLEKLTGFAATQEISRISMNPKVHYRTNKRRPPVSILHQPKQVHIPYHTSWRSTLILFIHLFLGLPSGLVPSIFPTKTLYKNLSSPIRATCPTHLILLHFITHTLLCEQYKSSHSLLFARMGPYKRPSIRASPQPSKGFRPTSCSALLSVQ